MIVCTPSIMHSGTHLLKYHILGFTDLPEGETIEGKDYQMGIHLTDRSMPVLENYFKAGYPIICPMRHPVRIRASFMSRGRPLTLEEEKEYNPVEIPEHLKKFVVNPPPGTFRGVNYESQWKNLISTTQRYKVRFIHVDDLENRDEQVRELSRFLDRQLSTNWPIHQNSGAIMGNHNLEVTSEMVDTIPSWIMDFYNTLLEK